MRDSREKPGIIPQLPQAGFLLFTPDRTGRLRYFPGLGRISDSSAVWPFFQTLLSGPVFTLRLGMGPAESQRVLEQWILEDRGWESFRGRGARRRSLEIHSERRGRGRPRMWFGGYRVREVMLPIESWLAHLWKAGKDSPARMRGHMVASLGAQRLNPDIERVCDLVGSALGRWRRAKRKVTAVEFTRRQRKLARRVLSTLLDGKWSARQIEAIEVRQEKAPAAAGNR